MDNPLDWTMDEPFNWTDELNSIFSDDRLGLELLKDPKGELPILAWKMYINEYSDNFVPVLFWCLDPNHPDVFPMDPQQAVDEAIPMVEEVIRHLESDDSSKALEASKVAFNTLAHGASFLQRKPGLAPSMQRTAVRAYSIRKFNPHPRNPQGSTVTWAKLADLVFLEDGKCPRSGCRLNKHQYNSRCVKALRTAFRNLCLAMERDGIPV